MNHCSLSPGTRTIVDKTGDLKVSLTAMESFLALDKLSLGARVLENSMPSKVTRTVAFVVLSREFYAIHRP